MFTLSNYNLPCKEHIFGILNLMGIAHLEIHISSAESSRRFYDLILPAVGFNRYLTMPNMIGYTDGEQNIVFAEADVRFRHFGFHRKRVGLNHIAFLVKSKSEVNKIYREIVIPNHLWVLYGGPQTYHEYHPEYYALYLEDPDRIKIEIAYIPESKHVPIKLSGDSISHDKETYEDR